MEATGTAKKRERLEARITPELKQQIQRAAALLGRTPTDFVISTVQAAAEATIHSHQVMELTAQQTEAFVTALENPAPPNQHLREAAERYRSFDLR